MFNLEIYQIQITKKINMVTFLSKFYIFFIFPPFSENTSLELKLKGIFSCNKTLQYKVYNEQKGFFFVSVHFVG